MALPGKELQRRWKARQKTKDKRQVTVMLSKRAYEGLNKIKEASKNSFSSIVDEAVVALSSAIDPLILNPEHSSDNLPKSHSRQNTLPEVFKNDFTGLQSRIDREENRPNDQELPLKEEKRFQFLLNNSRDAIWWSDVGTGKFEYMSPSAKTVFGYTSDELITIGPFGTLRLIHPKDQKKVARQIVSLSPTEAGETGAIIEYRAKHPKLGYRWMSTSRTVVFNKESEPMAIIGNTRDIHRRKLTELQLQKLRGELEEKVRERTARLEEANTALTLMLKKEQELKTELEDKILSNLKELVMPYMEKLKISRLGSNEKKYLSMMELNLGKIVSPFLRKLSSRFLSLTPAEVQVADLIRHGKTTKETAELLNLSERTIEGHRANVRKKIGIKNKKASLRSHLMSFE